MKPHAIDLFGEIPVTWDEVEEWVDRIQAISPTPWRRDWYIKNWNVIDKIRAAKHAGIFF